MDWANHTLILDLGVLGCSINKLNPDPTAKRELNKYLEDHPGVRVVICSIHREMFSLFDIADAITEIGNIKRVIDRTPWAMVVTPSTFGQEIRMWMYKNPAMAPYVVYADRPCTSVVLAVRDDVVWVNFPHFFLAEKLEGEVAQRVNELERMLRAVK